MVLVFSIPNTMVSFLFGIELLGAQQDRGTCSPNIYGNRNIFLFVIFPSPYGSPVPRPTFVVRLHRIIALSQLFATDRALAIETLCTKYVAVLVFKDPSIIAALRSFGRFRPTLYTPARRIIYPLAPYSTATLVDPVPLLISKRFDSVQ